MLQLVWDHFFVGSILVFKTLSIGANFVIGLLSSLGGSFLVGSLTDFFTQMIKNGWDFEKLDFASIFWSGFEMAILNTLSALTGGLAGGVSLLYEGIVDVFLGLLFSGLGAVIDILRGNLSKDDTNERKNSKKLLLSY